MIELTSFLASVTAAKNIATAVLEMSKDVAVKEKSVELLTVILSLQSDMMLMQSANSELVEAKRQLEEQLKNIEQWDKTAFEHELFRLRSGAVVVVAKNPDKSPYLKYWYCPTCFEKKKKFLLQPQHLPVYGNVQECPECSTRIRIGMLDSEEKSKVLAEERQKEKTIK